MKRNLLITGIAFFIILGGAVGAGAISNSPSTSSPSINEKTVSNTSLISIEKVTEVAINKVGGVIDSIELERENGRLIYEVELVVPDYKDDVEVNVDAVTGKILKVDWDENDDQYTHYKRHKDYEHYNDYKNHIAYKNTNTTKEEAKSMALKDSPGKIIDIDYDPDNHEYEFEIEQDNQEVEIKIDADIGIIIEKEIDYREN